jgi:DNA-binding NarL/FixJ family response regulator
MRPKRNYSILDFTNRDFIAGTKMTRTHILLADAQPKVRFALRVLLAQQPEWDVVGEAADAKDLMAKLTATRPRLILLGWELPGLAEIGCAEALRDVDPGLCVIALSGRPEAQQSALAAGADAFVSKSDPPERLLATICYCIRRQKQDSV